MRPYDATRTALYQPGTAETVFEGGHAYNVAQLAAEAARLAYYRFEKDPFESVRLGVALSLVGFGDPVAFHLPASGTEAFAAIRESDKLALVAVRGTQPGDLADLATDLKAVPVPWSESRGQVHSGFAKAALGLLPDVKAFLDGPAKDRAALVLAGHSLGAAIAVLLASALRPTHLFTFGCPRVGDETFVATLAGIGGARVVNCADLVTELPPELAIYKHYREPAYIDREGRVVEGAEASDIRTDRIQGSVEYIRDFAWKSGNVKMRGLSDHAPINYIRAFL